MGGVNERTLQTYAYKGSLPPHSAVARHHPQQRLRPGETNTGGRLPRGPRGVGVNATPVDKANLLFSFGVSDDAKASPALVEKFWGLSQPLLRTPPAISPRCRLDPPSRRCQRK